MTPEQYRTLADRLETRCLPQIVQPDELARESAAALRAAADQLEAVQVTLNNYAVTDEYNPGMTAAADEVGRLRAVIENAPHDSLCNQPDYPCRCWKADAL